MTASEETILFQSHDHIAGKLETLIYKLDRLNAQVEVLPELLRKILDLYLVADDYSNSTEITVICDVQKQMNYHMSVIEGVSK